MPKGKMYHVNSDPERSIMTRFRKPGPGGVPGEGASRGFGRSVARLLSARLVPGSLLLLSARSAGALEGELHVQALPADLGTDEGLQRVAQDAADALRRHHNSPRLQRLLLLNNTGESTFHSFCFVAAHSEGERKEKK
ncbi:hypothetical protein JRQ81_019982 [Phrynocephalus forsythii]|uniref:Uncharacterized protein n=1 Tax=Phrynocephalus forsythii TaxID=171643 RepID=A0A9Q0XMX7_9SAUR|nr:hypothetical protein JRQ81_019982 [Phrynocephalus forsythii]